MAEANRLCANSSSSKAKKLPEQVREELRLRRYSLRTEKPYTDWIKRYVRFHRMRSRTDLEESTVKVFAFLSHLAIEGRVAVPPETGAPLKALRATRSMKLG